MNQKRFDMLFKAGSPYKKFLFSNKLTQLWTDSFLRESKPTQFHNIILTHHNQILERKNQWAQWGHALPIWIYVFKRSSPYCLKLVGKFFVSVRFGSGGFKKILQKVKIQNLRWTIELKSFRKTFKLVWKMVHLIIIPWIISMIWAVCKISEDF